MIYAQMTMLSSSKPGFRQNAFHADEAKHAAWIEALQDRWDERRIRIVAVLVWDNKNVEKLDGNTSDAVKEILLQNVFNISCTNLRCKCTVTLRIH